MIIEFLKVLFKQRELKLAIFFCYDNYNFIIVFLLCRYHTDDEIKSQFAAMERKFVTIANFDANDNEISMAFPSLKVTADVSLLITIVPKFFQLEKKNKN